MIQVEVFPRNAVNILDRDFFNSLEIGIGRRKSVQGKCIGPDRSEPRDRVFLKFKLPTFLQRRGSRKVFLHAFLLDLGKDPAGISLELDRIIVLSKTECNKSNTCGRKRIERE